MLIRRGTCVFKIKLTCTEVCYRIRLINDSVYEDRCFYFNHIYFFNFFWHKDCYYSIMKVFFSIFFLSLNRFVICSIDLVCIINNASNERLTCLTHTECILFLQIWSTQLFIQNAIKSEYFELLVALFYNFMC